jgi:hypothetical protein
VGIGEEPALDDEQVVVGSSHLLPELVEIVGRVERHTVLAEQFR